MEEVEESKTEIVPKTPANQAKYAKKWKDKNQEKVKKYAKSYYQRHREKILSKVKEDYRVKNLDKNIEKLKKLTEIKI
jgi:hypothetical protein